MAVSNGFLLPGRVREALPAPIFFGIIKYKHYKSPELVPQTAMHTPTPFALLQGIKLQIVMVLPLTPLSLPLPALGPSLWTINNHNFRCPCIQPIDKILLPPPSRPCPAPFASLVEDVDCARPFLLALNVNDPRCQWFTHFVLYFPWSRPSDTDPRTSFFALLLSNADYPKPFLCC